VENGIPIIRLQNIERNRFIEKDIKFISKEKAEELSYHSYNTGDIVLAKLGDPIGKTCIVPDFFKSGIVIADVVRIRPNQSVNKKYLSYYLNSKDCERQLKMGMIGTTRPRVNLSQIRNLKVILPSISEQKTIASILSKVDDAIQKADEAINKMERIKKGMLYKLLSEGIGHNEFKETKIGKIPNEWAVKKLNQVVSIRNRSSRNNLESVANIPMELISANSMFCDYQVKIRSEIKSYTYCESGDLLLAKITPSLENGKQGIVPNSVPSGVAYASTEVFPLVAKNISNQLLHYILQSKKYRNKIIASMIGTTGRQRATKKSIEDLLVPIPSKDEQNEIVSILIDIDKKSELGRNRKLKLEKIKQSLMNDLLTGKKRIKSTQEKD
jgi:type I restriction enzyme S subunit